ncbi:MAG: class I mannose-6-phosphate isomerase [Ktedonobacteraceae bacterium]
MLYLYPIHLIPSLHETIWGGRRLARETWKTLPADAVAIGESWETETSTIIKNGPYAGLTLGALVDELGSLLFGEQSIAIFGQRFPLLAKFIDANAQLSVQVHPDDEYAATHEAGKLGKTEFWYVLAAEPGAKIVHGFKTLVNRASVQQAIEDTTLEELMHEEAVQAGDIIFVPAGTVHAIGGGILLYELQEYSDVTYRMYDYGRLTADGKPRQLHVAQSLDVTHYGPSRQVKAQPIHLVNTPDFSERCLVACQYFVVRELCFKHHSSLHATTDGSCIILTSLGAKVAVHYGANLKRSEQLVRGQTMVLPAALGDYCIEGNGTFLLSHVPKPGDRACELWMAHNQAYSAERAF